MKKNLYHVKLNFTQKNILTDFLCRLKQSWMKIIGAFLGGAFMGQVCNFITKSSCYGLLSKDVYMISANLLGVIEVIQENRYSACAV